MQTSIEGLIALIGHEGIVLSPYRDSVGVWTIGVGHTRAAGGLDPGTFKGKLTLQQVVDLLRDDIKKYEADVMRAVKVPLKQHEFDALVSFHFNTGGIGRANLTKSLNAGDKAKAAAQFMHWVTPKEITERRMAERDLFLTGRYPKATGTIYPATPGGRVVWGQGKRVDLRELLAGPASETPATPPYTPAPKTEPVGFWASLIAIIAKLFGRK